MKIKILPLCLLAFVFLLPLEAFGVQFTVNVSTDEHDANAGDGICDANLSTTGAQCTLRAAIEEANALPTSEQIFCGRNVTLTTANGGELVIQDNGQLSINFLNAAGNATVDGGTGTNRIFYINGATGTISGVNLTGGNGGGSFPNGYGGAIFVVNGALTLRAVSISNNTASFGGGMYIERGTHRIVDSTISGNIASLSGFARGGGFYVDPSVNLTIVNSTISNNSSDSDGGGFTSQGSTTLRNVTITNNVAARNGGGVSGGGTLNFGNTIIAGNRGNNSNPDISASGFPTSAGYNLIGDSPGDSSDTASPITYQPTDKLDVDPKLAPLADYGGNTLTHYLLNGSPAIDMGSNALAVDPGFFNNILIGDQRGFDRFVDGDGNGTRTVDIGSVEVPLRPTAANVTVSGRVTTGSGRGIKNVSITIIDAQGNQRTATSTTFGYYQFEDVAAGETVTLSAKARQYRFAQSTIVRTTSESIDDADFVSEQ